MKIKSGFVLEEVSGEYLAVAVGERAKEFSGFVRLNSVGAYFWKLMAEKSVTKEELVDAAVKDFEGVTREQVSTDIDNLVNALIEGGLVEA
jgi:hypothetical protein